MELASSSSVFTPVPIWIVVAVPEPDVRVKLPAARGVLLVATELEYADALEAILATTTT
jgi:hypothetical protein